MPVRRVVAHPEVKADRDRSPSSAGPLVYCAEGADNGGAVLDKMLPGRTALSNRSGARPCSAVSPTIDVPSAGRIPDVHPLLRLVPSRPERDARLVPDQARTSTPRTAGKWIRWKPALTAGSQRIPMTPTFRASRGGITRGRLNGCSANSRSRPKSAQWRFIGLTTPAPAVAGAPRAGGCFTSMAKNGSPVQGNPDFGTSLDQYNTSRFKPVPHRRCAWRCGFSRDSQVAFLSARPSNALPGSKSSEAGTTTLRQRK